jgi:hypothetical protein
MRGHGLSIRHHGANACEARRPNGALRFRCNGAGAMRGRVAGGEGKEAEVAGGYFGGYVKPANQKEYRRDRRLARNQNGKRKVVVVIRERGGNSVPAVFNTESQAASFIRARIAKGTVVHADEAASWDNLHERFEIKRINHQEAYSLDGACADMAEEYFFRLRRAEIGLHRHIAGACPLRYAQESSWREDNRRVSNGDQVNRLWQFPVRARTAGGQDDEARRGARITGQADALSKAVKEPGHSLGRVERAQGR